MGVSPLSSFFANGRWKNPARGAVLLGLLVAVALVLLGTINRNRSSTRRDAVDRYVRQVNIVEQGFGAEIARTNRAYRQLGTPRMDTARQQRELAGSVHSMTRLRARVVALDPPRDAERLHAELLRLFALERAFAIEVTRLPGFLAAVGTEQRALAAATVELQKGLLKAKQPGAQSRAFGRYAAAVRALVGPLARVSTPRALEPILQEQVARTRELASLAGQLRVAIAAGSGAEAQQLLGRFTTAAVPSSNAIERRAVIAYNSRVRAISEQRLVVERERIRLDRTLR